MESDTHEDALTLGEEGAVRKEGVVGEERAIPVSEDPDLVSVSENMLTQQREQQDLPVAAVLSALTDQGHISPFNVTSAQERVRSRLLPLFGYVNKRRFKLGVWLSVLLVALILVGVVSWLLFLQLAPNTDPWQSFSDTKMGFSVCYPTDWLVQVDRKQSSVHFYDSTQTGKVDVAVSSGTTASNIGQFLQQRASQLGMTNVTTMPSRSFAGTSWQQVQGKLSQDGVSYSVTILATMHGNRFYLFTQRSPQSTYNDEEALIFSGMRANLRFS